MLQLCFLFKGGGGFFVCGGSWIFCLMVVVGFVLIMVARFLFIVWLGFCLYGGGRAFCLMLVVGYLFIVMTEFFVYGSNCVFVLMVVTVFFV